MGYCERLSDGFWAEPLNALTNAAFLLAAVLVARDLRRLPGRPPPDLVALVVVLAAIAVGSFLFHTLATGWAGLADTLPILLFMLGYVVVFAHRFAGVRRAWAWLAAPGLVLLAVLARAADGTLGLGLPGTYLAALVALALLTGWLLARRDPAACRFAVVAGLFAVSLTLRQLDRPLCAVWPPGTHFGWHLCNAAVLYLLLHAATRRVAEGRTGQRLPVARAR